MKWIKYDYKHRPNKHEEVLVTDGKHYEFCALVDEYYLDTKPTGCLIWGYTRGSILRNFSFDLSKITHWARLEMPKKEK
jgi:hypothetical protein